MRQRGGTASSSDVVCFFVRQDAGGGLVMEHVHNSDGTL